METEELKEIFPHKRLTRIEWWESKRLKYNKGLIIAGVSAFVVYVIVGSALYADDVDFEITIFTTIFQGIGYLIMIGIANLCYFLGPLTDALINKKDDDRFREKLFKLGYWFSFTLPFLIPITLIIEYMHSANA